MNEIKEKILYCNNVDELNSLEQSIIDDKSDTYNYLDYVKIIKIIRDSIIDEKESNLYKALILILFKHGYTEDDIKVVSLDNGVTICDLEEFRAVLSKRRCGRHGVFFPEGREYYEFRPVIRLTDNRIIVHEFYNEFDHVYGKEECDFATLELKPYSVEFMN